MESKLRILKVPRSAKISIGGGGYSGVKTENTQSAKICRGHFGVKTENTQSAKICLNFNFRKGGSLIWFQRIWTKIYCLRSSVQKPACASQIVSHILRMWRLMKTKSWNSFMGKHCLWVGANIMRHRQKRDVDLSCLVLRRFPWMWQYFSYLISSPFKKTTGNNRDAKSKAQCEMPCPRKHKGNMIRFVFCLLLVHLRGWVGTKQCLSWNIR